VLAWSSLLALKPIEGLFMRIDESATIQIFFKNKMPANGLDLKTYYLSREFVS
jgi:hypothetical protein